MLFVCGRRRSRRAPRARSRAASGAIKYGWRPRAVLRRREQTCFSSAGDDEVGALPGRDPAQRAQRAEQSNRKQS
jgi:hypothetical protein